jgi:signal transduction histidine kinase
MNFRNEHESELENCRVHISKLKKENEELVRSLSDVNEKLHDSERLKGHFISNITNEIMNPFTSVLALAENIKQLKEGDISKAHHMAELIFEEAFHLDFQFKNIFAAALIEAGKEEVKCSVINLNELNNQISAYFQPLLNKKRIQLSICVSDESISNEPISFTSDREKLDLILKNLISNSIKYSPEDSVIEVNYFISTKELHLEVSDQGKGINPEDRKIIFDRFKQLDEKINSINTGHGLGLSIVQTYAEMLGGKVRLNDNFDRGINVMVFIPESADTSDWDDLEDFLLDSEASY